MVYGNYPQEIQDKIKQRVEEQGNVYHECVESGNGQTNGGFTWDKSKEGDSFWRQVLDNNNYNLFYELYPKEDKLKLLSTEPRTYIATTRNKKYKITIEEYED